MRNFLLLLAPFAPHISEEIWEICDFGRGDLSLQRWPQADLSMVTEDTIDLVVVTCAGQRKDARHDRGAKRVRNFLLLLAPFAPHISEEIWEICDFGCGDLSLQRWPQADLSMVTEDTIDLPVQVNGKTRGTIEVPNETCAGQRKDARHDRGAKRHWRGGSPEKGAGNGEYCPPCSGSRQHSSLYSGAWKNCQYRRVTGSRCI